MRENIYYWKYDSPLTLGEKQQTFFSDKYTASGTTEMVYDVVRNCLDKESFKLEPAGCDGNHLAYIISTEDRKYFFRADDGLTSDDYMAAESDLMQLVSQKGIRVPEIFYTGTIQQKYSINYQIMEFIDTPCLNVHLKNGTLNKKTIPFEMGQILKKIHAIKLNGFGFINTDSLKKNNILNGLDSDYPSYFFKRINDHCAALLTQKLLSAQKINTIREIFESCKPLLVLEKGSLVHRDFALWNILGTPSKITAVIDWDDAVSGDPADDIGILYCFHEEDFMAEVRRGYGLPEELDETFELRVWLHTLRNMLWKTALRGSLGYFNKGNTFFLMNQQNNGNLKEYSLNKIDTAIKKLQCMI